jgi:hypothetical protein
MTRNERTSSVNGTKFGFVEYFGANRYLTANKNKKSSTADRTGSF